MIIGNGDIAKALKGHDRKDFIFFAAGVSNSQEKDEGEYKREKYLLLEQDEDQHLVYFSSLGVFDQDTKYYEHKREMETLIKAVWNDYTIIRLGNIAWGENPNTFINAYKEKEYKIKNAWRYVIEKEEFLDWIEKIPTWSCEMNLPINKMTVKAALKLYGNA